MLPNVLLIVMDTARADAFEPYGAPPGSSPSVRQLAARGTAFQHAVAPSCWTMPSHASMLTGLTPRGIGLANAPEGKLVNVGPVLTANRDRYLPEVMRRAGYATTGISANPWISKRAGFSEGFEDFANIRGERRYPIVDQRFRAHMAWIWQGLLANVDDGLSAIERALNERLAAVKPPFFWFVNVLECHSPYMPPKPYNDLSSLNRLRVALEARRHLTLTAITRACAGEFDIPAGALRRMRHLYGRAIRSMDDFLGRLLEAFDRKKLLDDTIVIVTSDHGENLGEGALIGHALSLDHRLIGVPLVAAGPGVPASNGVMSLVSLPRMIAEAAGVTDHPFQEEWPPDVAVAQFNPPIPRDPERARKAIAELHLDARGMAMMTDHLTCATDGSIKLLRREDREYVIDLAADPLEVSPIPVEDQRAHRFGDLAKFRAAMDQADKPAGAEVTEEAPQLPAAEAAELEERMKLLGYL
jgi:arylsulfatase A-like enzyme